MRQTIVALFLVFAILGFSSFAHSQQQNKKESAEKAEPATKLEQFLSKKGRLYLKDFEDAGSVAGQYGTNISIKALIVYEPGKEMQKLCGLKVEVYEGGRFEKRKV